MQKRGVLHRLDHVLGVVARGTVAGEPDVDAGLAQPGDGGHPGGEDHVAGRVVDHVSAALGDQPDVLLGEVHAVVEHHRVAERAHVSEHADIAPARALAHEVVVFGSLRGVEMDARAVPA